MPIPVRWYSSTSLVKLQYQLSGTKNGTEMLFQSSLFLDYSYWLYFIFLCAASSFVYTSLLCVVIAKTVFIVIIRRRGVAQAEVYSLVAILDCAYEVVVAKMIVVDLNSRSFFYQIYIYDTIIDLPINMVSDIASPRTIVVMVNPISCT